MASMGIIVGDFIERSMKGQESGYYKFFRAKGMDFAPLSTPGMVNMLLPAMADYLNVCYKALILKNDAYVLESFQAMKAASMNGKHNDICLLNIIMRLVQLFHQGIDRSVFDTTSYEAFMASFDAEFARVRATIAPYIDGCFQHECSNNTDTAKLDPNEPLFTVKERSE